MFYPSASLAQFVTWLVRIFWGFLMRFRYSNKSVPPIKNSILLLPAVQLAAKINSGELTSTRVVRAYIERIKQVNPFINAVVDDCYDEALAEAKQVDEQLSSLRAAGNTEELSRLLREKPFLGVPVSIKMAFGVKGKKWTGGLWAARNRKAVKTADEVERLRKAGAIITCTSNIAEMTMWLESYNPAHGLTSNPFSLCHFPGGSSGGEGALVGSAASVMGIGSDIGGSVRIPASACGIFAHKPSPFLDYDSDFNAHCPACGNTKQQLMGVYGPMCRYASDIWPMLTTFLSDSGKAKLRKIEPSTVDFKRTKFLYFRHAVGDSSIAFSSGDGYILRAEPDKVAALDRVLDYLKNELKADVSPLVFDAPFDDLRMAEVPALWTTCLLLPDNFEAARSEWKTHDGRPWMDIMTIVGGQNYKNRQDIKTAVAKKLLCGGGLLPTGHHSWPVLWLANEDRKLSNLDPSIKRAMLRRAERFEQAFSELFLKHKKTHDNVIILSPVWPSTPYLHEAIIAQTGELAYTALYNITGLPVTVAPITKSKETNLPACIQIATARYDDAVSIAFAQHLESVFGGWRAPS